MLFGKMHLEKKDMVSAVMITFSFHAQQADIAIVSLAILQGIFVYSYDYVICSVACRII